MLPYTTTKYVVLTRAISYLLFCVHCAVLFCGHCMNTKKKLYAPKFLQIEILLITLEGNHKTLRKGLYKTKENECNIFIHMRIQILYSEVLSELGGNRFLYSNNFKISKYFLFCVRLETRPALIFHQKRSKSMVYYMMYCKEVENQILNV